MAEYLPISSTMSLRRNMGTDGNGKIITATVTVSRIAPSVDADSLYGVAEALSDCLQGTSIGYEKKSIDSLEM